MSKNFSDIFPWHPPLFFFALYFILIPNALFLGFFLRENVTSHTLWYFIFLFVCFPAFLSFASKLWQLSVSHINHIQLALVLCPLVSIARGIFTMNTAYFNFMLH